MSNQSHAYKEHRDTKGGWVTDCFFVFVDGDFPNYKKLNTTPPLYDKNNIFYFFVIFPKIQNSWGEGDQKSFNSFMALIGLRFFFNFKRFLIFLWTPCIHGIS